MKDDIIKPNTKTGKVYTLVFEILNKNPKGVKWVELNNMVIQKDPTLHPKTVNGCVWKLVEKFPDKVYKPQKGLFRLKKFKD